MCNFLKISFAAFLLLATWAPSYSATQFDGVWKFRPVTSNGRCAGAPGSITVKNGRISGFALSKDVGRMRVSGKFSENGSFKGALRANSGSYAGTVGTFKGKIVGGRADGTWRDVVGCKGKLILSR